MRDKIAQSVLKNTIQYFLKMKIASITSSNLSQSLLLNSYEKNKGKTFLKASVNKLSTVISSRNPFRYSMLVITAEILCVSQEFQRILMFALILAQKKVQFDDDLTLKVLSCVCM